MIRNYFDRYNTIPLPMSGVEPEDKLVVLLGKPYGYPAQMSRSRRLVQELGDNTGHSLSIIGDDIGGSDNEDLIVGIPDMTIEGVSSAGRVRVYYGVWDGMIGSPDEQFEQRTFGSTAEPTDSFGFSLAVGDFNGDGDNDLAVGSPGEKQENKPLSGFVHIFYGDGSVIDTGSLNVIDQVSGGENIEAEDMFGYSMAAGDFNGDGIDDLAVGSPFEDLDGEQDAGIVHVFFGIQDGRLGPSSTSELTQAFAGSEIESDDYFGFSITSGDFDGDGIDDLAVGSPGEHQSGKNESGFVHVFYGSSNGFGTSRNARINQAFGGSDVEEGDRFGHSMAAGDFDGDGNDDLAVGSPREDQHGADNSGYVHVFFGTGFSTGDVEKFGQDSTGQVREEGEQFGFSLASGDMNDDGFDDLAVSSPFRTSRGGYVNAGSVQLFPGRSDRALTEDFFVISNGNNDADHDTFGKSIAFVDLRWDSSRDGGDDLAISVPGMRDNFVYVYNNDFPCTGSCMRPWSGDDRAQRHQFRIFADTRPDGENEGSDYWTRPKIFIRNLYTKEEMSKVQLHEFAHYYHRVFLKKYAPNYGMNGGFDRLSDECEEQALDEGLGYWYASDFADRRWLGRKEYWTPITGRQLVYSNGVTSEGCQTSGKPEEHHLGDILTDAFWDIRQLPGTDKGLWTEAILNLVDTISPSDYGNSDPTGGSSTIKGFANLAYDQANSTGAFTGTAPGDACTVLLDHELRSDCP
jgi:hypothetical protein